jgi:hypothetical protein
MSGTIPERRVQALAPVGGSNQITSYSSPPCFLHELDPSYRGYLGRDEVLHLLEDLLAAELPGTRVERAWHHAMLLRHKARIDGPATLAPRLAGDLVGHERASGLSAVSGSSHERLAAELEVTLPRLENDSLKQDLEQILFLLKRDKPSHVGRRYG